VEAARRPEVLAALRQPLETGTRDEKIQLARIMAVSGDASAVPWLDKLSRDADSTVAQEGLRALRSLRAMNTPIRVLVAKPGLDGHDRGAKVIARALRDAGMEVIYTGLRQTPEMIVNAALQEDVQVIGLSMLSGAHNAVVPRVMELLRKTGMTGVKVIVGGIIPGDDARDLERQGVAKVFQPGASLESIVASVREAFARRHRKP
jgi:methylmalonyl-CoA mutase C-terminal domain/subunit